MSDLYDDVLRILAEESAWVGAHDTSAARRIAIAAYIKAEETVHASKHDERLISYMQERIDFLTAQIEAYEGQINKFVEVYPDMPLKRCGFCGAWARIPCGEGCNFDPVRDPDVQTVLTKAAKVTP